MLQILTHGKHDLLLLKWNEHQFNVISSEKPIITPLYPNHYNHYSNNAFLKLPLFTINIWLKCNELKRFKRIQSPRSKIFSTFYGHLSFHATLKITIKTRQRLLFYYLKIAFSTIIVTGNGTASINHPYVGKRKKYKIHV